MPRHRPRLRRAWRGLRRRSRVMLCARNGRISGAVLRPEVGLCSRAAAACVAASAGRASSARSWALPGIAGSTGGASTVEAISAALCVVSWSKNAVVSESDRAALASCPVPAECFVAGSRSRDRRSLAHGRAVRSGGPWGAGPGCRGRRCRRRPVRDLVLASRLRSARSDRLSGECGLRWCRSVRPSIGPPTSRRVR